MAASVADDVHAIQRVLDVELATGAKLSAERRAAVAGALLGRGYLRADLDRAADELATCPQLDRKLRFDGALSAADFRRILEGDPDHAASKLMSYAEANADALRRRIGFEHYRPVRIEGRDEPMWTPTWS